MSDDRSDLPPMQQQPNTDADLDQGTDESIGTEGEGRDVMGSDPDLDEDEDDEQDLPTTLGDVSDMDDDAVRGDR